MPHTNLRTDTNAAQDTGTATMAEVEGARLSGEWILYGASRPEWYNAARELIEEAGGSVLGIADRNEMLHTKDGFITSPKLLAAHPQAQVLVLSSRLAPIYAALRSQGFTQHLFAWPVLRYPAYPMTKLHWEPDWAQEHRATLQELYDLQDPTTAAMLGELFAERNAPRLYFPATEELLKFSGSERYFIDLPCNFNWGGVTLVDCGAFRGESLRDIAQVFGPVLKRAWELEPDPDNFTALCRSCGFETKEGDTAHSGALSPDLSGAKCTCLCCGAGESDSTVSFLAGSQFCSRVVEYAQAEKRPTISIQIRRLDDLVTEVEGTLLIKMDIEGAELAALRGAQELIRKHRPLLAVCVYHRLNDFEDIPRQLRAICPDYRLFLRDGLHPHCLAIPPEYLTH